MIRSWRPKTRVALAAVLLLPILAVGAGAATFRLLAPGGAPANDRFVDAIAVTYTFAGTTVDATGDAEEASAGVVGAGESAVWYRWTAPASGWAYVTPATGAGATLPTVKAYLGSAIDSLESVHRGATGSGTGGISIPAVEGNTYNLAVIGSGGGAAFDLAINQPSIAGSLNDEPDNAIDVGATVAEASATGTPQEIDIATLGGATAAPGELPTGGVAAAHSVWYTWTAATTGGQMSFAAVPMYGAAGPIRVAVYTGTDPGPDAGRGYEVGDLTLAPGGATGGPVNVIDGTTYFISVDGPESFFRLTATSTGVASNDDTTPPTVTCDPPPTGWTADERISVACTATDDDSGLALESDATFTLTVETTDGTETGDLSIPSRSVCDQAGNCTTAGPITGLKVDRKPPVVHCDPVDATWSAAASVDCTATDEGSGLADSADSARTFTTPVAPGTEGKVMIDGGDFCDAAGNCTTVGPFGPVGIDSKAPVVVCDAPGVGPFNTQVSVECTATDEGSGLAKSTQSEFTLTTDVPAGTASGSASTDSAEVCDLAGNCATAGPFTDLVVDLSPPSVTCTPDDGKTVDAWRDGPFTFTCAVSDEGTGLVDGTPASVKLVAALADGEASDAVAALSDGVTEVCDKAGSCVPVGPVNGLRIDRQAPTVSCASVGDGWHMGSASVSCAVDDAAGSGVAGAATVMLTATPRLGEEGTFDTGTAEVCDEVGNCTTAGPITGLKVDRRPPAIVCDAPASSYRVEARIPCRAVDGGSGLANPDDASFVLVTSVGHGNRDTAAKTDSRQVCDVAGMCATVSPIIVSVDLTGPPADGPTMKLPARVTVLSTYAPIGPTSVPFALPDVPGAVDVQCRPRPDTVFALGWTNVVCEAIDTQGTSLGSFPLVLKALPQLAPTTDGAPGGAWRAVGVGYAPGSDVVVEIAGENVAQGVAGPDGRVSIDVTIPEALPSGDHRLVLRGVDGERNPLLVVSPLTAISPDPGVAPPAEVPQGAPTLPGTGPAVPADPGPAPRGPDLGNIAPNTTVPGEPGAPATTIDLPGEGPGVTGEPGGVTTVPGQTPGTGTGTGRGGGGGFPTAYTRLPRTGADVAWWIGLGAVLTAAGALVLSARKRAARS